MKNNGFTLIELMIVIAIIGILAAVAVPQYSQYTKRAKYQEVRIAANPIKTAVVSCIQNNAGNPSCYSSNPVADIPGRITTKMLERAATAAMVNSLTLQKISNAPVITVTPNAVEGFTAAHTFVLSGTVATPTSSVDEHIVRWVASGEGCNNGWC